VRVSRRIQEKVTRECAKTEWGYSFLLSRLARAPTEQALSANRRFRRAAAAPTVGRLPSNERKSYTQKIIPVLKQTERLPALVHKSKENAPFSQHMTGFGALSGI